MPTPDRVNYMIKIPKLHTFFFFAAIAVMQLYSASYAKAASVTGAYKSVTNKNAAFSITIASPSPSNLIIQNHHTPGVKVSTESPSASKVNYREGTVKWLLKNTRPGSYSFSVNFAGPVSPADIYLILRYRDPATGNFLETQIRP